ncbi:MAG: hypothetical protein IPJ77_20965 [Planctomycetes bacterium]|nr:hypothetical protein [Planctomycetota bacterium]
MNPRDYPDARSFLAARWGSAWSAVEKELSAAGVDIDQYDLTTVAPWPERRSAFLDFLVEGLAKDRDARISSLCAHAEGGDLPNIGVDWSTIDPVVAEEVRDSIAPLERRLAAVATDLTDAIDATQIAAVDDTSTCRIEPIVLPSRTLAWMNPPRRDARYRAVHALHGWVVSIEIPTDSSPEFAAWDAELADLLDRRNALARGVLTAHRSR